MRPSTALLVLLLALSASLSASPQEPEVKISFTNTPLAKVLNLYRDLQGGGMLLVSEPLSQKLVSINTDEPLPRNKAITLIEGSLLNSYGIRIDIQQSNGWMIVLGPNEDHGNTSLRPLEPEGVIRCPTPRLLRQDHSVEMIFDKTSLAVVLELYEKLVGKPVQVSEDLRDRPVTINSIGKIPRSAAIKLIESRLGNYDIRIVEQEGALVAVGPKYEGAGTPTGGFRATLQGDRYACTFRGNGLLGSASGSETNAFNFNIRGLKSNWIDIPPRPKDWLYKLWPAP